MIYWFSLDKDSGHKFGVKRSKLRCIWKLGNCLDFLLFLIVLKFRRSGRITSSFQVVRTLKILWTSGPKVMSGRALFFIVKLQLTSNFVVRKFILQQNSQRGYQMQSPEREYCTNVSTNPITYNYQNFSPLVKGTDLNRQNYAILHTHWH